VITVVVALYATLRDYLPGAELGQAPPVDVPEGTALSHLLSEVLNLPSEQAKVVFVNGVSRKGDYVLCDGDRVAVFPPIGGG
jgi:molybdopterin synthase sulfur carrier subunit